MQQYAEVPFLYILPSKSSDTPVWSGNFHLEKVNMCYGSGAFSKETQWLFSFKVPVSKSPGIYVVLLQKCPSPTSSNGAWNKKRKRSSCKLQSGSADWLSSFAEREMLCSPMSFPPAGKKLPSTRSVSPSVPLIRRKCENLAHLEQEIVQYLGEKKEVFCWASKMFQESWIVLHSRAFIVQSSIKN